MPRKPKDSSLGAKLASLTNHAGLRQPDLRHDLGSGLCTLCDIVADDTSEDVFRKVSAKFEQAIKELSGFGDSTAEEVQILAQVYYNIAPYAQSRKKVLEDRRHWLAENENAENWRGQAGPKPIVRYGTGRNKMAKHVIPRLEKNFLAEWDERFPGEPFPIYQMQESSSTSNSILQSDESASKVKRLFSTKKRRILAVLLPLAMVAIGIPTFLVNANPSPGAICTANPGPLGIEQTGLQSTGSSWSVVFPADRSESARTFVNQVDQTSIADHGQFLKDELGAGAYLYGGMILRVEFKPLGPHEVVIREIRPNIRERTSIPVDTAIIIPNQGGDPVPAYFVLDDVRPTARMGDYAVDNSGQPLLFDVKRFAIRPEDPQQFVLSFYARYAAFSFDIIVDYEVDGVKCSRTINRDGQLYKVTPGACPDTFEEDKNRYRDLEPLKKLRYSVIRTVDADPITGALVIKPRDPEVYASTCGPG